MAVTLHHLPGHVTGKRHDAYGLRSAHPPAWRQKCVGGHASGNQPPPASGKLPMQPSSFRWASRGCGPTRQRLRSCIPLHRQARTVLTGRRNGGKGISKLCRHWMSAANASWFRGTTRPSPPLVLDLPTVRNRSKRSTCRHCNVLNSETRRPVFKRTTRAGYRERLRLFFAAVSIR